MPGVVGQYRYLESPPAQRLRSDRQPTLKNLKSSCISRCLLELGERQLFYFLRFEVEFYSSLARGQSLEAFRRIA
jgi:hypothetical protein